MSLIKIALADDHKMLCEGIEKNLNLKPDFKVIFTAYNGKELLQKLAKSEILPDIILLDLDMPVLSGWDTLPYLKERYPDIKVIIVSMHVDRVLINKLIESGASGYLSKNCESSELELAIRNVNENEYYLDKGFYSEIEFYKYKKMNENPPIKKNEIMSEIEIKILKLICKQKSSKEIGIELGLSNKTIEFYRSGMIKKTKSLNVVGLVYYAISNNLDF